MPETPMLLMLLLTLAAVPARQAGTPAVADTAEPRFADYPAPAAFRGKPAAPDLRSAPLARKYRTVLTEGAQAGPNFAGHYTVVTWGCGAGCQQLALVDARSGKVFFPRDIPYVSFADWPGEPYGLEYRLESTLLVIRGRRKEDDPRGIFFYRWDGTGLTFLKCIPR